MCVCVFGVLTLQRHNKGNATTHPLNPNQPPHPLSFRSLLGPRHPHNVVDCEPSTAHGYGEGRYPIRVCAGAAGMEGAWVVIKVRTVVRGNLWVGVYPLGCEARRSCL